MKLDASRLLIDRISQLIGYPFVIGDLSIQRDGIDEDDVELRNSHIAITTFLSSFLRTTSILEDIAKIPKFGSRFAWSGNSFRRSDHVRFVWMAFLHLVYVYHERVRVFQNALIEGKEHVPVAFSIDVGAELKELKKVIGPFMKERGEAVHEWYPDRREAAFLEIVEMLSEGGGEREWDVKGHYMDIRYNMIAVVRELHTRLAAYHLELLNRHTPLIEEWCAIFNDLRENAHADGLEVGTKQPKGWLKQGRSFFSRQYQFATEERVELSILCPSLCQCSV